MSVAPLAGARIEMTPSLSSVNWTESSLPSRERGLKSYPTEIIQTEALVAPLAGARIEILELKSSCASSMVAPLAGARIEIPTLEYYIPGRFRRSPRGSAD